MGSLTNTSVYFAKPPSPGPLSPQVFELKQQVVPALKPGQILVRNIYLSIDAGNRAKLDDRADYVVKSTVGEMEGGSGAVAQVVESLHPQWQAGDYLVTGNARWQRYSIHTPQDQTSASKLDPMLAYLRMLRKVDPTKGPLTMHLGMMGMVGFTAHIGISNIIKPKVGETVVISAAAGATGSCAGQFAKARGARVVGIAGGAEKCQHVINTLGFDGCIDYKAGNLIQQLKHACPEGIDGYFENVGGDIQKAVFSQMNDYGRIAMCGQVGQYSGEGEVAGPNLMNVILRQLSLQGFLAIDHIAAFPDFLKSAQQQYDSGHLKPHCSITQGLENSYEAINALVSGQNIGKQLCQVSSETTDTGV